MEEQATMWIVLSICALVITLLAPGVATITHSSLPYLSVALAWAGVASAAYARN